MAADDSLFEELYGLPRDQFVAERDRLVRALHEAGERDRARALARRRRPTRAAHALNRLAREHRDDLHRYVVDADDERLAVLLDAVEVHQDLIARVLVAARTDSQLAAAVMSGQLAWVPEPPDDSTASSARRALDDPDMRERLERAEARERDARAQIAQARAEVRELRRALHEAERRLHDAERQAQRVQAERRQTER